MQKEKKIDWEKTFDAFSQYYFLIKKNPSLKSSERSRIFF